MSNSPKYKIEQTTIFKKERKKMKKQNRNIDELESVVRKLSYGEKLEPKFKDHKLTGNYEGCRECHINPDWLLIYRIYEDQLILVLTRTGTHSELLNM